MIYGYRRKDARKRLRHHIGGIEPAAEPDFEEQHVRRAVGEQNEGRGGFDLEHCDRRVAVGPLAGLQGAHEIRIGHQNAAVRSSQPETLVHPHQIGRGVDVHPGAGGFQHGAHERDGRSLAVGAAHMDDRRQVLFRMAEPIEHMPHAIERKIDALGMQRQQPRQDGVHGRANVRLGHQTDLPRFCFCSTYERSTALMRRW